MRDTLLTRLDGVTVSFRGLRALDHVSLRLFAGGHAALLGPNGAGKSTLMRVVRGELYPDPGAGRVFWFPEGRPETSPLAGRGMAAGVSLAQIDRYTALGREMSGEALLLTGAANTDFLYSDPPEEDVARVRALAGENGMEALLSRPLGECSRGELCGLLLLRALAGAPRLLLIDEIFSGLDTVSHRRMLETLERAGRETTLLIATHRMSDLPPCVGREIRIDNGRITSDSALAGLPRGRADLAPPRPAERDPRAPELARARNATVYIDGKAVLHGLDWSLRRGESWVVTGGNGAGKSVFLRLLGGAHYAAAGGFLRRFHPETGEEIRTLDETRRMFRLVPDAPPAQAGVLSALGLVLTGFDAGLGVYREPTPEQVQEALRRMETVNAAHLAERPARMLSSGQIRRLLLARALVGSPHVLLLDDPLAGLDAASREVLRDVFAALIAEGVGLVLTAHHTEDLPESVRHVLRLEAGRAVAP